MIVRVVKDAVSGSRGISGILEDREALGVSGAAVRATNEVVAVVGAVPIARVASVSTGEAGSRVRPFRTRSRRPTSIPRCGGIC